MLNEVKLKPLKSQWQEMLTESIADTLQAIAEHMPEQASKHNALLVLKARLNEVNQQKIMRVLSQEQLSLAYNQLRYDILAFIDQLTIADFEPAPMPLGVSPDGPRRGTLLHKIPRRMAVDKEEECIIRIAYERAMIANDLDITEEVEVKEITISKIMQAELIDPNDEAAFKIRTYADEEQFLQEGEYTEWKFFVTPLREGALALLLKVSVVEVIEGKERTRNISWEEQVNIVSATEETEEAIFQDSGLQLAFNGNADTSIPGSEKAGSQHEKYQESPRSIDALDHTPPSPAPVAPSAPMQPIPPKKKKSRMGALSIATSVAVAIGVALFIGVPMQGEDSTADEEGKPSSIITPSDKEEYHSLEPGEVKLSVEDAWAETLKKDNADYYRLFIKAFPGSEQAKKAELLLEKFNEE